MAETRYTSRRHVVMVDPLGLHLRAAAKLVALARSFRSDIAIICNGIQADGKSALDLMTLAAEGGVALEIEAHGHDADEAVTALADLLAAGSDGTGDGGGDDEHRGLDPGTYR